MSEPDFTLEKLRIVQRLGDLDTRSERINGTLDLIRQEMKSDRKKLTDLGVDIWGNGKAGIKMDLDRLKQREKLKTWILSVIGAGLIGLIIRSI